MLTELNTKTSFSLDRGNRGVGERGKGREESLGKLKEW